MVDSPSSPTVMDPRASHALVTEMVRCYRLPARETVRKRGPTPQRDQAKRYATYFPSKASFNTKWNFTDDESTWEFSAPVALMARSSVDSNTGTNSSTSSSPAQQIVLRYRAGMHSDPASTQCSIASNMSTDSNYSWKTAPLDNASISAHHGSHSTEHNGLKAIHRQSRYDALVDTLEEAIAVMKKDGRGEHDRLVCHRPGCRDTVRDVKALMYHLHIHNIHDRSFTCASCNKQCESTFQLNLHRCPSQQTRLRSPPTSPIRDRLLRVLAKISHPSRV